MTSPPAARRAQLDHLRRLCGGAVHLPGDPLYDEARRQWNLRADVRPAAVAYPAFSDEVADVVRAAAAVGLHVAPQGTGHAGPPLAGRLDDAVLLRTGAITGMAVRPEAGSAQVGAGVLWGDVIQRAGAARLACRHMSSPSVGVVGSSLGGGLSWYGRRYGLQCSALTAVEVVLADGSFVRATDDADADLLWAARGGGGGFGVVTAIEFDLVPVATAYAGLMAWEWGQAQRVLRGWAHWAGDLPEEATTVVRLFQAPEDPALPQGIRGRNVVVIDGAVVGDPQRAETMLAPLRAMRPELDTFGVVPAASLARLHLEPEAPTATYVDSVLLGDLPEDAVDALVAAAGPRSGSRLMFTEVRQLGGALSRPAPRGGALDRVNGSYLAIAVGADPTSWSGYRDDADRLLGSLAPWRTGGVYLSMIDDDGDPLQAWSTPSWQRLKNVRSAVDPEGLFIVPHSTK